MHVLICGQLQQAEWEMYGCEWEMDGCGEDSRGPKINLTSARLSP